METFIPTAWHPVGANALPVEARLDEWLQLVRAQYLEMPGLHLTEGQAQRLWGLDRVTTGTLLSTLVAARSLKRTSRALTCAPIWTDRLHHRVCRLKCCMAVARSCDTPRTDLPIAPGRTVKRMEWPSTLADGDAMIVREETTDGPRFVVHSRRAPQFACRTYTEAETRAVSYARRARTQVWSKNGHDLRLVNGLAPEAISPPPPSRPSRRRQTRHPQS